MDQNEKEIQFLKDTVSMVKEARKGMLKAASGGKRVVDFTRLRELDMGIKQCEDEIRRSTC